MPTYLAMGMTSEEYWKGDPYLTVVYRKAWDLRKEQRNHEMWLQGLYVYDAVGSIMSSLFKGKGQQAAKYPDKPYRLTPLTEEEKAQKKIEIHNQLTRYFQAKKEAFERNNGRRDNDGTPNHSEHQ